MKRIARLQMAAKALQLYNKNVYEIAQNAVRERKKEKFVSICKSVNIEQETAELIYEESLGPADLSW